MLLVYDFLGFKDHSNKRLQYLLKFFGIFQFQWLENIIVNLRFYAFGPVTYVVKIVFHAFLLLVIFQSIKSDCIFLIIANWEMPVQLSSASLSLAEDNSLVHELRITTAAVVLLSQT